MESSGDPRGEIETFVSRKNHVTDWHTDFMENFTVQLAGTKKWEFRRGSVRAPLRGITPHYKAAGNAEEQLKAALLSGDVFPMSSATDEVETVELQPGDVMYFPGMRTIHALPHTKHLTPCLSRS